MTLYLSDEMGTRSITRFAKDSTSAPFAAFYCQFDGYLDGHGEKLRTAFGHFNIVNGMQRGQRDIANGMGCLAAQVVAVLKKEPGNVYMVEADGGDEEFNYRLYASDTDENGIGVGQVMVKAEAYGKTLYEGLLSYLPGDSNEDDE